MNKSEIAEQAMREAARLQHWVHATWPTHTKGTKGSGRSRARARASGTGGRARKSSATVPPFIIKKLKGSAGTDDYINKTKRGEAPPELLCTNMAGRDPKERAVEFAAAASLRPRIESPELHLIVSYDPGRGEAGSKLLTQMLQKFLAREGLANHDYIAVRHAPTPKHPHDHAHLIVSRISRSGEVHSDSNDYKRYMSTLREIEAELGLVPRQRSPGEVSRAAPGESAQRAKRMTARSGQDQDAAWIDPSVIIREARSASSPVDLAARLTKLDIQMDISRSADGQPRGVLFRKGGAGAWLAGSSIDRALSLPAITRRLEQNSREALHHQRSRQQSVKSVSYPSERN
jgi:hypothetical protein